MMNGRNGAMELVLVLVAILQDPESKIKAKLPLREATYFILLRGM